MTSTPTIRFLDDPLGYFDQRIHAGEEAFWIAPTLLCVAEPSVAKRVLANPDGLFEEHSDFFHTRRGAFGPRSLQVSLGRTARKLLSAHVSARAEALPETIRRVLDGTSEWPDAGNHLIYEHLGAALVTPAHRARIGDMVDRIVVRGVLAGARESRSWLARALFRRKAFRALTREVEHRMDELSRGGVDAPRDLFDVLAMGAGPDVRPTDLGELYLPFLFAVVGSVGFTLGWALYLLGTNPRTDAETDWIVREALRLWPIAWQLARRPAETHEVAGIEVSPRQQVLVSPYVTQRHPAYWSEPDRFRPERWSEGAVHGAFLPFGWGPHTCAAASLTLEIVREVLAVLLRDHEIAVTPRSDRPFIGPSLAPPRFELALSPKGS
jgi:hypothetical protein